MLTVLLSRAVSPLSTCPGICAKGLTKPCWLVTPFMILTIGIPDTANRNTGHYRVALQAMGAKADASMIFTLAFCSGAALSGSAGVNTLLPNTSFAEGTVRIGLTFI